MDQDTSQSQPVEPKDEPNLSEESNFTTSTDTRDTNYRRLSVVKDNSDQLKNLVQRNIYVDTMRSFLAKVKLNCQHVDLDEELGLLLLAVSCIDLTTLAGDDTATNVERLCHRAINALDSDVLPEMSNIHCGAVCVYPARVTDCVRTFKRLDAEGQVNIAAVATGFPSGQYGLKTRIAEIKEAVESGANEIDVVINRPAAICGNWDVLFEEIREMRKACDIRKEDGHEVHLKVIIGAGDLLTSSTSTIYNASLVSILGGANFVKTSTGKESVNATLPIGYIMMRAIADYYNLTGVKIGFKPAGGIRTYKDALAWLMLVKMLLGPEWMSNKMFRFGASGLLDDVEKRIQHLVKLRRKR